MTNSQALVDEFNPKFQLSKEKEESFLSSVDIQQTGSPATQSPSRQCAVGVTPVSTSVGPKNIYNFVVPPSATTLGIVCDSGKFQTLYHLLYDSSAHSMSFYFVGSASLLPLSTLITPIGTTTYSWETVFLIGYFLFDTNDLLNRRNVVERIRGAVRLSPCILELSNFCKFVASHSMSSPASSSARLVHGWFGEL
jgi:hypothetical protein